MRIAASILALVGLSTPVLADGSHAIHQEGAVRSAQNQTIVADSDILAAHVHRTGNNTVTFHMTTRGVAGETRPEPVGTLAGAGGCGPMSGRSRLTRRRWGLREKAGYWPWWRRRILILTTRRCLTRTAMVI